MSTGNPRRIRVKVQETEDPWRMEWKAGGGGGRDTKGGNKVGDDKHGTPETGISGIGGFRSRHGGRGGGGAEGKSYRVKEERRMGPQTLSNFL